MHYSKKYNFNDLFVFDMANNHQGDLDHALKIVNEIGKISQKKQIKGVMKFQFRELDTFIHPKFKTFNGNDQIKRFTTTRLEASDFKVLYKACKKNNLPAHPARMPPELAEFFIRFLTKRKSLVLDPFAGSNTTGYVASKLGRKWLSIEKDLNYIKGSNGWFK